MKFQLAKMRKAFGRRVEWLVPDATVPWEPDPGESVGSYFGERSDIERRLSNGKPFVQWFRFRGHAPEPLSLLSACRWLEGFLECQAPVDMLVTFSSSTVVVNRLTDLYQSQGLHAPWRLTIACNSQPTADPPFTCMPLWQPLVYITSPSVPAYTSQRAAVPILYRDVLFLEHPDGIGFPTSEPEAGALYERLAAEVWAHCSFVPAIAC